MGQPQYYTDNDTAVLIIWMVIFGIALFAALIDCQQGNFKNQIINLKRRHFWLSISGLLAAFTIIGTFFLQYAEIKDYVLLRFPFVICSVAFLSIILLLIARTPALLQNPEGNEAEIRFFLRPISFHLPMLYCHYCYLHKTFSLHF